MFDFTVGLSTIPPRYRDVEPDVELSAVLLGGDDLHIVGRVGTGKSTAACAILKGAYGRDPSLSVGYINAYDLQGARSDDDEWRQQETKLYDVDVLAIDGIDIGLSSAEGYEALHRVLKRRYPASKHTITTSFGDGNELMARMSRFSNDDLARAIVSRIQELSEVLHLHGPDRRQLS